MGSILLAYRSYEFDNSALNTYETLEKSLQPQLRYTDVKCRSDWPESQLEINLEQSFSGFFHFSHVKITNN